MDVVLWEGLGDPCANAGGAEGTCGVCTLPTLPTVILFEGKKEFSSVQRVLQGGFIWLKTFIKSLPGGIQRPLEF